MSIETSPASQYAVLLTLTYGATPTVVRYCRWTSNLTISGQEFICEPALDVVLPKQTYAVEDQAGNFSLPRGREPIQTMSGGFAFPKVKVLIEQIEPSDLSSRRALFFGWCGQTIRNANGKPGVNRVQLVGVKSRLAEVKLSIPATTTCDLRFGGIICGADINPWKRNGTVQSIGSPSRNVIRLTIPSVTNPVTELPNNRYRRGCIIVDGMPLFVRKSLENGSFEMFRIPPAWIIGKSCTLRPGCDKRYETCDEIWGRKTQFRGLGVKTPARNPVFEKS